MVAAKRTRRRSCRIGTRDSCASCGERGELLRCHRCPPAFHLRCCYVRARFNPPMNKEMLSSGDWMCHGCVVHRKRREQRKEQINGLLECQLVEQLSSPVPEP
ncbi:hypothetical protein AGIG_G2849, partial [Arapaima gigas]